eukprot:CAMPEP_0116926964 /NCGR_PEP_ID=MMETSP0467-20121206/25049_1 /TAXON_ID=283647 /ORGANISM="Mesodinium pulex, Strain SPMC105" /LENGTH=39 /DNA_ID= /DNA_START= /DNA_END= /DNA_ORIENTATION=
MKHEVASKSPAHIWYGEDYEIKSYVVAPWRESSAVDALD